MHRTSRTGLVSLVICGFCSCAGVVWAQGLPGQLPGRLPGKPPGQLPGKPASPAPQSAAAAVPGMPLDACCDVTAINKATGIVSARQRSGGKPLEFRVVDASLLTAIRVGQDVFADISGKRVSLDRKTFCCAIVTVETVVSATPSRTAPPAPAPVAPKVVAAQPSPPASSQPNALHSRIAPRTPAPLAPKVVAAQPQIASSQPNALPGKVLTGPGAIARTAPGGPAPAIPPGIKGGIAGTAVGINPATLGARAPSEPLPQLTAGTFRQMAPVQMRDGAQMVVSPGVVQLQGIEGIRGAAIPQGAKDFLVLHARTLQAHEEDTYVVNVKHAEEWFKTHKVPESVGKAAKDDGKKKSKGCSRKNISTDCVKNEAQQSLDDLTKVWRTAWKDTSDEAMRDWNKAQDCFSDHELPPLSVPVAFSTKNEFPVPISIPNANGSLSMAVPVNANFTATLKVFYIPCLPFAVRPKSLGANGWLETGGILKGSLTTGGQIGHTFVFPIGGGGSTFSMGSIPVGIHGAPVATMEIALYIEGRLTLDGKATMNGNVSLTSLQKVGYNFECSGHGCNMSLQGLPEPPTTAVESVKLDGRMIVKPEIYSALKLSFGGRMLEARAGAHPYLLGELYGCGGATAVQTTAGDLSVTPSHALTADLDWGFNMRAEAFVANKRVVLKELNAASAFGGGSAKRTHLLFKDLAQSSGLIPTVTGSKQGSVGQLSAFTIKMPQCYPFRDAPDNALQYQVKWTGDASPTGSAGTARSSRAVGLLPAKAGANTPTATADACSFQSGQATCQGTPSRDTAFQLAWPASGSYMVSVIPVSDKHGHKFESSAVRQFTITVQ